MTVMLSEYNIYDTEDLLMQILRTTYSGNRVSFLTPAGEGQAVVQRNRVALSRSRKRNMARGRKVKRFRMRSTIHSHTDLSGKRHDCIVMWIEETEANRLDMLLEDMLDETKGFN